MTRTGHSCCGATGSPRSSGATSCSAAWWTNGEEFAGTAAREAAEESGWEPVGEPEHLISFEPLPGQTTAPMDVYLWRNAKHIGEPTDTEEQGRVEWVPLSRVQELAQRKELLGAGTLVALLYYLASRNAGDAP